MIGPLSNPHGGFSVSDGRIEAAEVGENFGEQGFRERRLDNGPAKALSALLALECHVPLEEGDRLAEFAPDEVRDAEEGRCEHLDRAIAAGSRDGEGLLP